MTTWAFWFFLLARPVVYGGVLLLTGAAALDSTGAAAGFNYNSFLEFPDGKALSNTGELLASGDNGTVFAIASSDSLTSTDAVVTMGYGGVSTSVNV